MPTARLWWCVTKNAGQELCTRVCGVWKARSAKCAQKRSSKKLGYEGLQGKSCRLAKIVTLICSRLDEPRNSSGANRGRSGALARAEGSRAVQRKGESVENGDTIC